MRWKNKKLGIASWIVLAVVAVLIYRSQYDASNTPAGPPYNVVLTGTMPTTETVGQHIELNFAVANKGRAIPNLALQFDGLDNWVVDNVRCVLCLHTKAIQAVEPAPSYAFGPLPKGEGIEVHMDLTAKTAGNHSLTLIASPDADQSTGIIVTEDLSAVGGYANWDVAINP